MVNVHAICTHELPDFIQLIFLGKMINQKSNLWHIQGRIQEFWLVGAWNFFQRHGDMVPP